MVIFLKGFLLKGFIMAKKSGSNGGVNFTLFEVPSGNAVPFKNALVRKFKGLPPAVGVFDGSLMEDRSLTTDSWLVYVHRSSVRSSRGFGASDVTSDERYKFMRSASDVVGAYDLHTVNVLRREPLW